MTFFYHLVFALFLAVTPALVFAQEENQENLPVEEPLTVEEVSSEVPPSNSEEIDEEPKTEDIPEIAPVLPVEDAPAPVLEENKAPATSSMDVSLPDLETLSEVVASSSSNDALPFTLVSPKMSFEINEVPSFVFSYALTSSSKKESTLLLEMAEVFSDTVADMYEGSLVEIIVDAVVGAVDAAVEVFIPHAEGQEREQADESNEVASTSEASNTASTSIDADTAEPLGESEALVSSSSQPVLLQSFALVDGKRYAVDIYDDHNGMFTVNFIDSIFSVGAHTLELHMVFKDAVYVAYYAFSVEGSVLYVLPLYDATSAVLISDDAGYQTLWLQENASGTVHSFEFLADEASMERDPILEFTQGILFWTTPLKDALVGFDTSNKSTFSLTLNRNTRDENMLQLQRGAFDVHVDADSIGLEFVPEEIQP